MKFQVERNWIDVVGRIWMPPVIAAMRYDLNEYDLGNIEKPYTRETVEHWLMLHSGDFQEVIDFCAIVGEVRILWSNDDNEMTFNDCMYGSEDD